MRGSMASERIILNVARFVAAGGIAAVHAGAG